MGMSLESKLEKELQEALIRGWDEFQSSVECNNLEKAFDWLVHKSGFYESGFRGIIPHPAYDYGARHVGKYFVTLARINGICFDPAFPGTYDDSTEENKGGIEYRTFKLFAFRGGESLGIWYVTFSHLHDRFHFPEPPKLEVVMHKSAAS